MVSSSFFMTIEIVSPFFLETSGEALARTFSSSFPQFSGRSSNSPSHCALFLHGAPSLAAELFLGGDQGFSSFDSPGSGVRPNVQHLRLTPCLHALFGERLVTWMTGIKDG